MTLLDNLRVPLLAEKRDPDEAQADMRRWLERFDLWRLRHNHASELSGGQQKLLELARVLVARPSLVLLDEPFAGVHPMLAKLMMKAIAELPAQGMSVLMVSHDLTTVYELSSHVLVMNEGQLLARGTPAEVQANPAVVEAYLGT
jgi:branched-chain amino acid transport system ATP-binding protein